MTREERIKSYQANIFGAILDPKGISQENFEYLIDVIPTYLKIMLDIEEVQIKYCNLDGYYGEFIPNKNTIELSQGYFTVKDNEWDNILILEDLIQFCTHELYHALDTRELDKNNSIRENQSWQHQEGVGKLSLFFPEKEQEYNKFTKAMYAISRSECFARQGALLMLQNFGQDMESFVVEKIRDKNLWEQIQQIQEYFENAEKHGDYETRPNVEQDAWMASNMMAKCDLFEDKRRFEVEREKSIMELAFLKKTMLSEIKEDFLRASEIIKNSDNQTYDEKTLMYMASTQDLSDFYNETTLNNFLRYAIENNQKGLLYVCRCAELEQIKRRESAQRIDKEDLQQQL
ncbi:MAG: hypothetical protein IJA22_00555 [Clostridia bacterium]|nr:hypothetical protein [Clostridia bacterium]